MLQKLWLQLTTIWIVQLALCAQLGFAHRGESELAMGEVRLIANKCGGGGERPRAFRTFNRKRYRKSALKKGFTKGTIPSDKGLDKFYASVSGQHCLDRRGDWLVSYFRKMLDSKKFDKVVVLDARLEAHGFLDGLAVSWHMRFNNWERIDMPPSTLEHDERERMKRLAKKRSVEIWDKPVPEFSAFTNGRIFEYSKVTTEREVWDGVPGVTYFRLHQPDHCPPFAEEVDTFIKLFDRLAKERVWYHVHCKGGAGRSTAVIAFLDMLVNADKASFDDMVMRHYIMGHSNLFEQEGSAENQAKDRCYKARVAFLREFHKFCNMRIRKGSKILWTEYLSKRD